MSVLRMDNTSLRQCGASNLAVYKGGLQDTTLWAGSSEVIGTDNLTGCLPDALVFCEDAMFEENIECPSLAFRRPVEVVPNQLDLVSSYGMVPACSERVPSQLEVAKLLVSACDTLSKPQWLRADTPSFCVG